MDRFLVISGDGHASAPLGAIASYLDPGARTLMDELARENWAFVDLMVKPSWPSRETLDEFDTRGLVRSGGAFGAVNPTIRLEQLDAEGIAAEVVHPHSQINCAAFFTDRSPEIRFAAVRAYHRWLADFIEECDGRVFGVMEAGPCVDMDATVAELEWGRARGFVSVGTPGSLPAPEAPPIFDAHFEPYWSACEDLGLVVSVHAGWAGVGREAARGSTIERLSSMMEQGDFRQFAGDGLDCTLADREMTTRGSQMRLRLQQPRRVMWQLMASGVLDRHPRLKIVFTEVRADWVPRTLAHLTARFAEKGVQCACTPREYWERNFLVVPSSIHRAEVEMRHEIGVRQLGFGQDYPHWEGVWPDTLAWCQDAFRGVPEEELRAILGGNVAAFYGLPVERLEPIAARIGPPLADVMGDHPVDERLLQYFHRRAGYLRPADPVFPDEIDHALDPDLDLVFSRGATSFT